MNIEAAHRKDWCPRSEPIRHAPETIRSLLIPGSTAAAQSMISALPLGAFKAPSSIAPTTFRHHPAGCTHLQRGQPITGGHHLLAYVEMLERI